MEGKVALLLIFSLTGFTIAMDVGEQTYPAMYETSFRTMYMSENEPEVLQARSTSRSLKLDSPKSDVAEETSPSELTTVYKANNQPIYFKSTATSEYKPDQNSKYVDAAYLTSKFGSAIPNLKADQKVKYVDEAYIAAKYGRETPTVKEEQKVKYVDEAYIAAKYGGATSFAKSGAVASKDAYTYIVVNSQGTPIYKYVESPRDTEEPTKYKYITAPKSHTEPLESYKYIIVSKSEPQEPKYTYKFVSPSESQPSIKYIVAPKQASEVAKYAIKYIDAP